MNFLFFKKKIEILLIYSVFCFDKPHFFINLLLILIIFVGVILSSKEKKVICVFGSLYLCGNVLKDN